MKKFIVYSLVSLIFNFSCCQAFSQQGSNDSDLGSFIDPKSLSEPLTLQKWYIPKIEVPFIANPLSLQGAFKTSSLTRSTSTVKSSGMTNTTTSSSNNTENNGLTSSEAAGETGLSNGIIGLGSSLPLAIGSMVLSVFLSRHPSKNDIPEIIGKVDESEVVQDDESKNNYEFKYGEEVNFNLILRSKNDAILKSDGNILVKLPIWLQYVDNSSEINNQKLSDKLDVDSLTYLSDDSLLIINLDKVQIDKELTFSFSTKVLTQTISEKEAFCLVKYVSKNGKSESKWNEISIYKDISDKNNEN